MLPELGVDEGPPTVVEPSITAVDVVKATGVVGGFVSEIDVDDIGEVV